ncbi:MAG: GTPase [Crocinitomicaceae bacterium]
MQLIFVYNANSGFLNGAMDTLHKIIKPQTYQCSLCQLTYGSVKMKSKWKEFLESLPMDKEFYHKDEFLEKYPNKNIELPAVLISEDESDPTTLLSAHQLADAEDLNQLIEMLQEKLSRHDIKSADK